MALKIITSKRFLNAVQKTTKYLKEEWSKKVAEEFTILVIYKIQLLSKQPNIGRDTSLKNIKSVLAGKGHQQRIYYRVEKDKLIIVNMKDTRRNPKHNPFNKTK
ncbi:MAG: type II toxin-antitoxin system RelE/ParE family toxin [Ferruginibacter sp.]|nr:type II toxin-antitoxin system RelE/ParE family toxin [Ferruginibacter sp.]